MKSVGKYFTIKKIFPFFKEITLRDKLKKFSDSININLHNEQIQIILSVIKLANIHASRVKVPYAKIVALPITATLKQAVKILKNSGFSRIPIYKKQEGIRVFIGILYAKKLFPALISREGRFKIADYMEKIKMVPETKSLLSLMRRMRLNREHLMLTVNEYGEVTGLVTLEDILEEIVGDIRDEFDRKSLSIKQINEKSFLVDASLPLHELNSKLSINLPEEKFNTLSGFILHEFKGEINADTTIHYGNVEIQIHHFKYNNIKSAKIDIVNSID